MKLKAIAVLTVLISLAGLSLQAQAMDMGKNDMNMNAGGHYIMLQDASEAGVTARAHLKDIKEAMAKLGMSATNHFMVMFTDQKSGAQIKGGLVALKITDPHGKVSEPVHLMPMDGAFGADITLPDKGRYQLEIGTKLQDGQKRKFHFTYTVK